MSDLDASPRGVPYGVPPEGSLGLLALGYRGLVAWREARGPNWTDALDLPPLSESEADGPAGPDSPPAE